MSEILVSVITSIIAQLIVAFLSYTFKLLTNLWRKKDR